MTCSISRRTRAPLRVRCLKMPSQNLSSAMVKGNHVDMKRRYRRPEARTRKLTERDRSLTLDIQIIFGRHLLRIQHRPAKRLNVTTYSVAPNTYPGAATSGYGPWVVAVGSCTLNQRRPNTARAGGGPPVPVHGSPPGRYPQSWRCASSEFAAQWPMRGRRRSFPMVFLPIRRWSEWPEHERVRPDRRSRRNRRRYARVRVVAGAADNPLTVRASWPGLAGMGEQAPIGATFDDGNRSAQIR